MAHKPSLQFTLPQSRVDRMIEGHAQNGTLQHLYGLFAEQVYEACLEEHKLSRPKTDFRMVNMSLSISPSGVDDNRLWIMAAIVDVSDAQVHILTSI